MSFLGNFTARLNLGMNSSKIEHFFALNIGQETLTICLWAIANQRLKLLNTVATRYTSIDDLLPETDKLLDQVLGSEVNEPEKILFGVPDSWLTDDNLKDQYLTLLRRVVKELEIKPMAYVSTSHALSHLLEKLEGAPTTAIIVGIEEQFLTVFVVRAGKSDGVKVVKRGDNIGADIEKALLSFTDVEVLPSRILIHGSLNLKPGRDLDKHKTILLSFPWMAKLSFLHFPKIDILENDIEVKAIAFAGASELDNNVRLEKDLIIQSSVKNSGLATITEDLEDENKDGLKEDNKKEEMETLPTKKPLSSGFVIGDITKNKQKTKDLDDKPLEEEEDTDKETDTPSAKDEEEDMEEEKGSDIMVQEHENLVTPPSEYSASLNKSVKSSKSPLSLSVFAKGIIFLPVLLLVLLGVGFIVIPQAKVSIYVEPRVLERDTQVTADPSIKEVDEEGKRIPGQIIESQVSGTDKVAATGKKNVGDPAKGTVVIYNKTDAPKSLSKGTILNSSGGLKFTLDSSVSVASQSAIEGGISFGKANVDVTASVIGADGNLPSGTELTLSAYPSSQLSAKVEGNFSGGTSKEVTVVTDADQKKLLATLAASLRKKAQEELQEKIEGKKILEEALSEEIVKKTYSKNINDQAQEFSLNLTIKYQGTAYSEEDLKTVVSKLISTNIPEDFELNLAETETQADVSKVEKDGRLVFLARFRAKLMPKVDIDQIIGQIKGKTPSEAAEILKGYENVLGSDIQLTPSLPGFLQRLPFLDRNIKVEVGLK